MASEVKGESGVAAAASSVDSDSKLDRLRDALARAEAPVAPGDAAATGASMDQGDDLDDEVIEHIIEGMCIECGDQPAILECNQCADPFCEVCFLSCHKKGARKKHTTKILALPTHLANLVTGRSHMQLSKEEREIIRIATEEGKKSEAKTEAAPSASSSSSSSSSSSGPVTLASAPAPAGETEVKEKPKKSTGPDIADDRKKLGDGELGDDEFDKRAVIGSAHDHSTPLTGTWFLERSRYIPLRLSLKQRKYLRLLEAAMTVSEYTDKIDIISHKDKARRILQQLKDVCAILSGLVVSADYKEGQKLIVGKEFKENATFFQTIFEFGRRHKIRNPEKMRDAYGKLIYLLQDSVIPEIQDLLQFSLVRPIHTVHSLLGERGALAVLEDELMATATGEILADGKSRPEIDRMIKTKERAIETIARRYANDSISYEDIRLCLLSIGDNHSYLRSNRDPCDKMITYLTSLFRPDSYDTHFSLAIMGGRAGARLTHSHTAQYHYVHQSLTLWREIAQDMFKLWYLAEEDLLDEANAYRLRNTGQGLNRVQGCPRIGRAMHNILSSVQRKVGGGWVGSSVVHLGDTNVPNALMFIDKYNQVSRILNPIVICLGQIDKIYDKPDLKAYIDTTWGNPTNLRRVILTDFFRHAFDGSGADNFFDAGSCIDGRLTSAWNWCQLLDKKPYYPIFLLTGFVGFDGAF